MESNSTNSTPKVSVIIPIYNVEDFLAECLDSVLAQTLPDIEIICVNDGSTDSSPDILSKYVARDSRIVRIDKENGGYGKAVNRGLDEARGEWIAIVEPDDFIDPRMYEDLTELGDAAPGEAPIDIVKGSYWLYYHLEDEEPYIERPNLMNCMVQGVTELDVRTDPELLKHHPSIWSAIYRRDFLTVNGIRMIEPKGAGWADNPWLFDTVLRAKRIIWTPAPYYYYRQTNPNASSKLKDFHLPFDRLRDIRGIYEKLGITDKKLLSVLYLRSFNYINATLLEEFRFPENDPEMEALIQEVFDSFDEELLLDKNTDIPAKRKNYYRDFMGVNLQKVKPYAACENPRISYIIPMRDDRAGLWETLYSLVDQMFQDIEIICVDCASHDRSAAIARGLAAIDKRVQVLEGAASLAEGATMGLAQARGEYVHFLRAGVGIGSWSSLRDLIENLDATHGGGDVVIFRRKFQASRLIPPKSKLKSLVLINEGIENDIALTSFPAVYTRLFKRTFLEETGIGWDDPADEYGLGLCVKAAAFARTAALVAADDAGSGTREAIDRDAIDDEDGLIEHILAKYVATGRAAEEVGTDAAWRVARSIITCHMATDVAKIGRHRSGRKYFEALRDVFENEYGIRAAKLADYSNYLDVGVLEEAFSLDYEDYAKYLLAHQQQDLINVSAHRNSLASKLDKVDSSGSYVLGKKVGAIAKKVIPRNARREYIYRSMKKENEQKEG